jgi:CubicO group peptidase (beta-lactamase class C family)
VIRRVTRRSLKEFVRDETAGPLGADFQIGAVRADYDRIAEIVPPPPPELPLDQLPEDSPMRKTFSGPPPNADAANTPAWRDAHMGALNGHGNARCVAAILSVISLGGMARGVRLLKPETVDLIFGEQASGVDLVLPAPLRWASDTGFPRKRRSPTYPTGRSASGVVGVDRWR